MYVFIIINNIESEFILLLNVLYSYKISYREDQFYTTVNCLFKFQGRRYYQDLKLEEKWHAINKLCYVYNKLVDPVDNRYILNMPIIGENSLPLLEKTVEFSHYLSAS